ncbi:hypothetical protein GCM10011588_52980 [Nocardia jinanensis]|uniref:Major facilitator superfamily (MFS) profile domain-containing protein n=1 Tax=Nocardia jinanensis TaxID=382504 RepID=A0A917RTU2_9NOCA|nr:MFS transporter [Nocardia jinanensis]GGL31700.1 hypothetical protein GCM10011588_52980 [Nocardia jinanensis]
MSGPATALSASTVTRPNWVVLALTFLAVVLDSYDTIALGLSIPALSEGWGASASHFTPALSLTSLGVAVGHIAVGRSAARFGSKRVILAAGVVFTVGSSLTAGAPSIWKLTVLRFATGLGLGAVMPAAVAHATVLNPPRLRQSIAVFVTMGISLGALLAGILGSRLVGAYGWQSVFIAGALASAVLFPLLWLGLPDPTPPTTSVCPATEQ